ncbi:hypothetical protein Tco_1210115 [Tanacetum coccineum]
MVNVIPPDHVDDVPVVEPNQHDDVLVDLEHVLVDEDEDLEEDEFEEEEDDMEVDIEDDENEPELTYPYEETARGGLLPSLMWKDINSLFGQIASLSRRLCGCEMAHALVEKKGKAKDKYYESVDASIATEWARKANVRNDASGSGPVRGQDTTPVVRECTFDGFMKCNLVVFHGVEGAVELQRWFKKTESRFNELALMCPRMVEPERVKVDAYIRGLTNNIKGEVTSSKPADLNKAVCMAHKLMEQKSLLKRINEAMFVKKRSRSCGSICSYTNLHKCSIEMALKHSSFISTIISLPTIASRIRLFIKGKKHDRMMLDSIDNGPLVYPTVEENGQTRPTKYSKLTEAQQLQDNYDVQATNIILHDLPHDVYAL